MRFLSWYLGIASPAPGRGVEWRLHLSSPWDQTFPAWLLVILAIVGAAAVVLIYRRDARRMAPAKRIGLVALRFASLSLVLIMLAQVSLAVTQIGLPTLAILIDTSASMGQEDHFRERDAVQAAARLTEEKTTQPPTRIELAKALFTADNGRFLSELQRSHRLQIYQFDSAAAPLEVVSGGDEENGPLLDAISRLQADGEATRPASAVRQVLEDLRGNAPTALLILTDGISSTGENDRLVFAGNELRAQGVPLIPIGFGSDEPLKDVRLTDLLADDVVFADDPLTFSVQVKSYGYAGQRAQLSLRRGEQKTVVDTTEVELPADGESVAAELADTPTDEGDLEYVVDVDVLPGETDADNNQLSHRVRVRKEQLRVLLVEGLPRWEFRYLKPLLERDPTILLHTVLQSADLSFPDEDSTALAQFPVTLDALLAYDVIILGDIDLAYLSSEALPNLRQFVAERGGGLIMIAGPQHNPAAYGGTVLEDLLPVELAETEEIRIDRTFTEGYRPVLTIEGRNRAALRLSGSIEDQARVWEALPPLYWISESGRRKPGAQVLAEHPTWQTASGSAPVLVLQRFGAGQVLFHATDELWRWRERVEDRYYGPYWLQMIRYLSRSKLRGDSAMWELVTDRSVYQQGDPVELQLRVLGPDVDFPEGFLPEVIIEGPGALRETIRLAPHAQTQRLFVGRVSALPEGPFHAQLSGTMPQRPHEARSGSAPAAERDLPSVDFRVEPPAGELQSVAFQSSELEQAAQMSHGRYYPFWEADRFLSEIPSGRTVPISAEVFVPLWNRWELLVLLTILLATEWISRKRAGLI